MMPLILTKPLEFGNAQQIEALRNLEKDREYRAAWDLVEDCNQCLGDGYRCNACGSSCDVCDGTGKDHEALMKFREEFPECRIC